MALVCVMAASSTIAITAANAQAAADLPPPAEDAASAGGVGLGEIVVTAEKRATNLQKTPVSITALSGDMLQKSQIRNLTEVKGLVPGMQMGETDGYAQITIRGIGIANFVPGADSAVALNLNDVYVSRPIAQLTGLYDLSSLEVLRGPQGTLFGRNATAGAINMTTTRPTDTWSGYGRVTIGNYAAVNVEGAIGGPIAGDMLTFRVAGFIDKHNGYGRNLTTGNPVGDKDARGIRGTLVFQPTPNLKATIIGEYYKQSDHGAALHYLGAAGLIPLPGTTGQPILSVQQGGFVTTNRQNTVTALDSKFRLRTTAVTGILEWSQGPFGLKSITGYRDQNSRTFTPLDDGSTANGFYLAGEPAHQFSEELQAHYDTSRLHATAGLYYFKEKDASIPGVSPFKYSALQNFFGPIFGIPPIPASQDYYVDFVEIGGTLRTTAKAAFGQVSYEVLDGLTLTAGIRYSHEKKSAALNNSFSLTDPWTFQTPPPPVSYRDSTTFSSTTPKFGIQYQVTPKTLLYASYSKGFKSGGYDVTAIAPPFKPEKLTAYEGGVKTTLLDNRLRFNLGGFYYDYTNLQVAQVIGAQVFTTNAATARVYGGEAEITFAPTQAFQLDLAASYLHSRYQKYCGPSSVQTGFQLPADSACARLLGGPTPVGVVDFSGNKLNNAPDFSGHAAATYTLEMPHGSLALRGELEFTTRIYFTPDNADMISQSGYLKQNAFVTYTSNGGWHVTGFVRNLSNKDTWTSGQVSTPILGSPVHGAVAPPRTFGVEVGYKF
jgi:iron complex outermembrane receptor protein